MKVCIISFVCKSPAIHFFKNKVINIPKKYKFYISSIIQEAKNAFNLSLNSEITEFHVKNPAFAGANQVIRIYMEQLLIVIMSHDIETKKINISGNSSTNSKLIPSIIEVLNNNIYQRLSNKDICGKLNYSSSFISKVFKENYGYSIQKYFLLLKVEEAKKLLRERKYNITQISDTLSFDNPQYFSRVFKKITGIVPKEYLSRIKTDADLSKADLFYDDRNGKYNELHK